ncbi:MAG TPA: hypothetical protein VJW20_15280 [Candidatus Angelobacter sp.]|nr:hypothetical protein [Candidatus Angelobacter sp.]
MSGFGLSPTPTPNPLPTANAAAKAATTAALHRSANWLFLIAGLSVVNVVTMVSGSNWIFLGGLGVTQIAAAVAMQFGTKAQITAVFITLWATAFFVCLGYFARKGQKWAFITGMALYGVDAIFVLLGQIWLMLLFHGFVLFRLYQGYSSCNTLHAFDKPYTGSGMPIGS